MEQDMLPSQLSIASVLFDASMDKCFDYTIPPHLLGKINVGMRVRVPVRTKERLATVLELKSTSPIASLQTIAEIASDAPYLPADLLALAHWMATYYVSPLGKVLKAILPASIRKEPKNQSALSSEPLSLTDEEYFPTRPKVLNAEQHAALDAIKETLIQGNFQTRLIFGITGSGKTEIYLQAIQYVLDLKKGVIFLVPEIALTSQTLERLKGRFKEKVALLHHRLTPKQRRETWHGIREGKTPIVVGARSAIFSPIPHLGLVIVDEEHEASYKQSDEAPQYNARDVAVMRAKLSQAVALLGSATPSLESYHNAMRGKYTLSALNTRADSAHLPHVHIVDMRAKNKNKSLFSDELLEAIKKRVAIGEQTLLLLNRRGLHTARLCKRCHHAMHCPQCDIALTFHLGNVLSCHLCDFRLSPPPRTCPQCHAEGDFTFKGVGTQMLESSLRAIFPHARTLRIDADTTRQKGSHLELFKQFKAGKADVLIGTQMIAKGLHFPSVTLVGILHADAGLQIPDFRSSEAVFQLLTQVSGRSGRSLLSGEVIIQTHMPDHPIICLAKEQNYADFYTLEIATREQFHFPPFTHLVKLIFSGKDEKKTSAYALHTRQLLTHSLPSCVHLFPVVACGHARIKTKYRFQFLIKTQTLQPLSSHLSALKAKKHPLNIHLTIDVDPQHTFF